MRSININNVKNWIEELVENHLNYISGQNVVIIKSFDWSSGHIEVNRSGETVTINFERIKNLVYKLSEGKPVHVDTFFGSGGNDRTIIETVVASFPMVGFMKGKKGRNNSSNKVLQWFDREIHNLGEMLDVSGENLTIDGEEVPIKDLLLGRSLLLSNLSKPFILLAGISGTGKSRFVREQARLNSDDSSSGSKPDNYELVSVRPDWHEPSDLLGYVTRLSGRPQFVSTDVLKFMVQAWKKIAPTTEEFEERKFTFKPELKPFWLCLDEMNLAPIEQYFADYLSVLETRKIEKNDEGGFIYSCYPLIKASVFEDLLPSKASSDYSGVYKLAQDLSLNLDDENDKQLFECFLNHGIPLPYNLIVAGTVNMDETTHGFSRKVIDRALTLDFGEFFPNDFDQYGKNDIQPIALSYPILTQFESQTLDSDVALQETREFLKEVNKVLEGTMFELAYRALNEALLMVHSFQPGSPEKLCAVWDDFLMMKVLPRIEGDEDKLAVVNEENGEIQNLTVLQKLEAVLNPAQKVEQTDSINAQNLASDPEESTVEDSDDSNSLDGLSSKMLAPIWGGEKRPDLWREGAGNIECRSRKKIKQMQTKLKRGFTTFWP